MALEVTTQIAGIKESLAVLQDLDKSTRRLITKDYQKIMQPVISEAKHRVPLQDPLSGWARNWTTSSGFKMLPWEGTVGLAYIKSGVSAKRPREYRDFTKNLAAFYVRWAGATNTMYDMAGRGNPKTAKGQQMAASLAERWGRPSRVMWPSLLDNWPEIETRMQALVKEVEASANRVLQNPAMTTTKGANWKYRG